MYIFLSYSRADLAIAEQIVANLKQAGHEVFFDKHSINASEDFNRVIWGEIQKADLFVYLISENSVRIGSYALTELTLAEKKWPNPESKLLPVLIEPTDLANMPIYASICNILQPEGNIAARVRIEVNELSKRHLRKKIGRLAMILLLMLIIAGGGVFAYRHYIAQTPEIARTKLGVMNVIYDSETFLDSAYRGDLNAIKLFLAAGMNPNTVNKEGDTVLMKAVVGGHIDIVKLLTESAIDLNIANKSDATALSIAVAREEDTILAVLLNAGARIDELAFANAARKGYLSVLKTLLSASSMLEQSIIDEGFISAAENGQHEVLALLLDKLSDQSKIASVALNQSSINLWKVKSRGASFVEFTKVFKYLLDLGANVNNKDADGCTPLIRFAVYGKSGLAKMLLDMKADPNAKCDNSKEGGLTALIAVLERGNSLQQKKDFIELLFASGVDVNQSKDNGETPLMLAAGESLELVQILLEKGAKVNDRSVNGEAAIHFAIKSGRVDVMTALFDQGLIIDPEDNLLITAVDKKSFSVVQKLLQQGVDINKTDAKGQTALMHAVKWGDSDMVRLLLIKEANASIQDNMGRTAELFASRNEKNREMIELLQKKGKVK